MPWLQAITWWGRKCASAPHHHVGQTMADLVVGVDDGARERGVQKRAFGRRHRDSPPASGVGRYQTVRVDRRLQPAIDAGGGNRKRCVDRSLHLPVGSVEIDQDRVARLADLHADPDWRIAAFVVIGDTVAIEEIGETALAVRQVREHGAHQPLGVVHDRAHRVRQDVRTVSPGQRLDPFDRAQRRCELCPEVAAALVGGADIGKDDLLDIRLQGALRDQSHRRQA